MRSEVSSPETIYLLGAGASANALPVVNQMKDRMKVFLCFLKIENYNKNKEDFTYLKNEKLITKILKIINDLEDRRSIDTLAKELWLQGGESQEYLNLKEVLNHYLIFEEMYSDDDVRRIFSIFYSKIKSSGLGDIEEIIAIKLKDNQLFEKIGHDIAFEINIHFIMPHNTDFDISMVETTIKLLFSKEGNKHTNNKTKLDQRYTNFLVDILDSSETEHTIQIFSWNYDTQLISAFKKLNLGALPSFLKEVKLNGTLSNQSNSANYTGFGWEEKNGVNKKIEKIDMSNALHFIAIGYTFPFANRETDIKIIESLMKESTAKRLLSLPKSVLDVVSLGSNREVSFYIQTQSEDDYLSVKESLESIIDVVNKKNNSKIIPKYYPKYDRVSFYIPLNH
jgi:hypothetical protein